MRRDSLEEKELNRQSAKPPRKARRIERRDAEALRYEGRKGILVRVQQFEKAVHST
jgi:hypothetical protein